jgi:uncharacterized membrane protein YfcA
VILGLDPGVVVVLAAALVVGAAVQGTVGLGLGLVGAPVAAMVAPQTMPDLLIWLALLLPMVTLVREHHEIDWFGLAWSLPFRVPGTVLGVWLVTWFSTRELGVAIGVMVLAAVALTWRAVELPVRRSTLTGAGLVSGVTGTATSIGGPPMALLYQRRPAHQVRSTLGIYFLVGAGMSLVGLALGGELVTQDFKLAILLVPCLVAGFAISGPIRRHVDAGHTRAAVLMVCAASAVVLIVRSLL